jgi:hypothetical protein
MSPNLKHDRWSVSDSDFAVRIIVPDLKGYFDNLPLLGNAPQGRTLVIEPGTRALVIEDGQLVGELLPGAYTLESFLERLQFWLKKQTTIFLVREEDVPLNGLVKDAPSMESVCLDLEYRWTLQIQDILSFMENLMGARESLSISELQGLLDPMVSQAVYSTAGHQPVEILTGPKLLEILDDGLHSQLDVKLQRYGLSFRDLQSARAHCENDSWQQRQGDLWLEGRENQLQRAATKVESDSLQAKLEDIRSKVPVIKELRDAVNSDKFNKLQSKEEFSKALLEIDKGRVLRQEERETLVAAYEERKEDRGQLRAHLLETMDLHREQELEDLRVEMDYAVRQKSLQKEIELAQLSHSEEGQQWRHELQQEQERASHRRQQKHENVKARWERVREARQQKRDDSWQSILHDQKMEEVRADLEVARAERQRKLSLLQAEHQSRLAAEKLDVQKRQKEWELEYKQHKSASQLEKMQKLQEMNAQFAERQQRMQVEMENLKSDSASKRELERIQAMGSLGTEALVATAGAENAALLADLKKHEATQDAVKAQAAANPAAELNEERLRMYEKMNDTERAKADAIAEAYKAAMQSQQGNVGQMIGGLAQASSPPPVAPLPGSPPTPPQMPTTEVWHVSLSGQQSPALQMVQVQQYIQSGQVTPESLVWKTGMVAWAPAGQIAELTGLFGAGGPPPIPGSTP